MNSSGVVTSGQIEAMCKANAPRLTTAGTVLRKMTDSYTAADHCVGAKASCVSGPVLNCDDVPEAALQTSTRRGPRQKLRGKPITLPVLAEVENDFTDHESYVELESDADRVWSCFSCTFINHGSLQACEVCQTSRYDLCGQALEHSQLNSSPPAMDQEEWPELALRMPSDGDSWIECDASSHASSWLDVGNLSDLPMAGDEWDSGILVSADITERSDASKPVSWSERLKGGGIVQVTPLQSTRKPDIIPPLVRRNPSHRAVRSADASESLELVNLEEQRLYPSVSRGATQRRCNGKRSR